MGPIRGQQDPDGPHVGPMNLALRDPMIVLPAPVSMSETTSNGSWCTGIKGEMSGSVCVTFTWDMYIYMSCLYFLFVSLFVHYYNMMVCVVYCVGKWQGWGQFNSGIGIAAQFQFQFWNWNWNRWNWKWNWNWRLWNWNWKPKLIFLQLLPHHLLVNQQFTNFSFNRGHNLPCDWLLMQQGLSSWNITPL